MIKHIVVFTFIAERQALIIEIKAELEALMGVVPTLKAIEVGINCNPKESNDLVLSSLFDNLDDLNAYAVHPAHQAVAAKIRANLASRACVDYAI